jgi:enediyne polyketide synthase
MSIRIKTGRARPAAATGVFALRGRDRPSLIAALERIAAIAPRLSYHGLHDLACQLGRETAGASAAGPGPGAADGGAPGADAGRRPAFPGGVPGTRAAGRSRDPGGDREIRVTVTASNQDQLAERARRGAALVGAVPGGSMVGDTGVRVSCGARGRVMLVFPGHAIPSGTAPGGTAWPAAEAAEAATLARSLGVLRWLERLGVRAAAAVGHGLGEIAGLVWAGSLPAPEAARLIAQHGQVRRGLGVMRTAMVRVVADEAPTAALRGSCRLAVAADESPRSHVLAGPASGIRDLTRQAAALGVTASTLNAAHALHTPVMAPCAAPLRSVLAQFRFGPPRQRLVSTVTARELTPQDDIAAILCAQLTSPVRFREALRTASDGADLILFAGADEALAAAAGACGVPAIGFPPSGWLPGEGVADCAAALFAAGAMTDAAALAPVWADPAGAGPAAIRAGEHVWDIRGYDPAGHLVIA